MESLAYFAIITLAVIYGSSFIALGFSWSGSRAARIVTFVFASIGALTGLWISTLLIVGNGLLIGGIPLAISVFSVWNTLRAKKRVNR